MAFLQARDLKAAVRAVQESAAGARSAAEATQRALMLTQRATVIVGEPRAVWLRDANERLVGCRLLVSWHNVAWTLDLMARLRAAIVDGTFEIVRADVAAAWP